MDTISIDDKDYEVTGVADDGLPILRGVATTTQEGFDEDGNPKISTIINVPAIDLAGTPGEVN